MSKAIDELTQVEETVKEINSEIGTSSKLHRISNHPVHLIDEEGNLSPSAFIPFCGFNSNMSVVGVKIWQFDNPVCNIFKPNHLNDQLCYEADINGLVEFSTESLKFGFTMLIDTNEDRQFKWKSEYEEKDLTTGK